MSKRLIFIIGKTSSGKDTVAKYISEKYGILTVCSYTTRGMRNYEVDGVQHYFVSKERMKEIVDTENVIAYVKFPKTEIEYCATLELIEGDIAIYIIDPSGVKWFKENCCYEDVSFFSIYVDLDERTIIERAKLRGDKVEDIEKRLDSERELFDNFLHNGDFDYYIDNSKELVDLLGNIDRVMREEGILKS